MLILLKKLVEESGIVVPIIFIFDAIYLTNYYSGKEVCLIYIIISNITSKLQTKILIEYTLIVVLILV